MNDTNLTAFKTDLRNVSWNSMNHSPETNQNMKDFLAKDLKNRLNKNKNYILNP